ncbi:MAG TPA: pantoate--beta-alanine ligase [Geobacteraceae bacterium]
MQLIESTSEMQQLAMAARALGQRVVLVPTMGYLHEGHASLMRAGRQRGDLLVTSIFVNPTQFGAGEDFSTYPRDLARDRQLAEAAGVDVIFAPTAADMYPAGFQTYVEVGELTRPLCGASRAGHFRGVTTVVCKLFGIVQPHVALFGKKDFQQLAVIRQMTADLNLPVEIVGLSIVREGDGLAMSSRNAYLSPAERQSALCLSRAIAAVRQAYRSGERQAGILQQLAVSVVVAEPAAAIDYIELRDSGTLAPSEQADERTLLALAVKIGRTRLIDNGVLGEED